MSIRKLARTFEGTGLVAGRMERWFLLQQGQVDVDEALIATLNQLARPGVSDRSGAFHASQVGGCQRRSLFDFHDLPKRLITDPALALKFMDGTWRHIRWQVAMLQAGVADEVEVAVESPSLRFTGSIDGVGTHDGEQFGIEVKGWSVIPEEPVPYHVMQVNGYMLMSGLKRFAIVYEHKSTQTVKEFLVYRDEQLIAEIRAELESLNQRIEDQTLPEMLTGCMKKTGQEWKQCPYRHICPDIYEWEDMAYAAMKDYWGEEGESE